MKRILVLLITYTLSLTALAQVPGYTKLSGQSGYVTNSLKVGAAAAADASAIMDASSTSKGMLIPRMTTTQRDAIASPATGLFIYNITTNAYNYYQAGWKVLAGGATGAANGLRIASGNIELGGNLTHDTTAVRFTSGSQAVSFMNAATGHLLAFGDIDQTGAPALAAIYPRIQFNTDTLHIELNGSPGTTGQVLTSDVNGDGFWGSGNFWNLTGNSGTNPATNFIGTTDAQPLVFRTNNFIEGYIDGATPNYFIGYANAINFTTGSNNCGFGDQTLEAITSGNGNTHMGSTAGSFVTTGSENSLFGASAGADISTGSNNICIGSGSRAGAGNAANRIAIGNATATADGEFALDAAITQLNFPLNGQTAGYVLTTDGTKADWQQAPGTSHNIALTAQTASILGTNIPGTSTAGTYSIEFYLVTTTADAGAVSVSVDFTWNDGTAARTIASSALPLTSTGYINHVTGTTNGNMILTDGSGSIQYSTTVNTIGTATYALYISVIKLS